VERNAKGVSSWDQFVSLLFNIQEAPLHPERYRRMKSNKETNESHVPSSLGQLSYSLITNLQKIQVLLTSDSSS
jgi:hypothetical protein